MQAAAVQQQLMVAALSCDSVKLYNSFVIAYQKELYAADRQLLKFFRRMKPRGGELDYHSFKTRMANMSSQLSIHDIASFCTTSKAAFALALGPTRSNLADFVATQPIIETSTYQVCEFRVAGGILPHAPKTVPVPVDKPGTQLALLPAVANVVTAPVRAAATVVAVPVKAAVSVVGGLFSHLPPFNRVAQLKPAPATPITTASASDVDTAPTPPPFAGSIPTPIPKPARSAH